MKIGVHAQFCPLWATCVSLVVDEVLQIFSGLYHIVHAVEVQLILYGYCSLVALMFQIFYYGREIHIAFGYWLFLSKFVGVVACGIFAVFSVNVFHERAKELYCVGWVGLAIEQQVGHVARA